MKKENALVFGFKLSEITTDEFAVIDEAFKDGKKVSLGTNIAFGIDLENKAIGIKLKFQYEQSNKPFIIIAATCVFQIEEKVWNSLINQEAQKIVFPEKFASHLAVLTVGTIRGILHEKTKGTPYNKFILPPINLTELIKQDIEIDLEKAEEAK